MSAYELYGQGNIDGVVDYSPSEKSSSPDNLRLAIVGAISNVEGRVKEFVSENPYILDHYRQSLTRYLNPSKSLLAMQTSASLKLTKNLLNISTSLGLRIDICGIFKFGRGSRRLTLHSMVA